MFTHIRALIYILELALSTRGNDQNFLRRAPPRTPLGLSPQTPMKNGAPLTLQVCLDYVPFTVTSALHFGARVFGRYLHFGRYQPSSDRLTQTGEGESPCFGSVDTCTSGPGFSVDTWSLSFWRGGQECSVRQRSIRSTECPPWALATRGSLSCFIVFRLSPTGGGEAGVPNLLSYPTSPFRESTVVSVALGGRSLPVVCRGVRVAVGQPERTGGSAGCWPRLPASPCATRSAPMAWVLRARAPAARLIAASRSGLGVRRSALSAAFAHRPSACCTPALHRRRAPAKAAHGAQLEAPNCAVPLEEAPAQEQVLVRLLADPLARVTVRSSCA